MPRISSRLILLLSCFFLFNNLYAGYNYRKITKPETQHIIDSLEKSDFRTIEKKLLTDSFLFRERIYVELYGIHYCRYFYPGGKLRSEGLCDYRNAGGNFMDEDRQWEDHALLETARIGTWKFYDKNGNAKMEYDYSTGRDTTFLSAHDPQENSFVKVSKAAEDFFIAHFGNDFYTTHIRLSPFISWIPGGRKGGETSVYWPVNFESDDYELCTPDLPLKRASGYLLKVEFVFEDTIVAESEIIQFDSVYTLKKIGWNTKIKSYKPFQCVKIDYREALNAAQQRGFTGQLHFEWNIYGCNWQTDERNGAASDSSFRMDVCSGEVFVGIAMKEKFAHRMKLCGTNFTADCPANRQVAQGWKRLDFSDFELDVPVTWIHIEIRKGSGLHESYLVNGNDSIVIGPFCYLYARFMHFDEVKDTTSTNKFLAQFPGNEMQGRKIDLLILKEQYLYDIDLRLKEKNGTEYKLEAKVNSPGERDEAIEILETIRFKKCK